jgi:PAS domain S-box-containing protein|tara:strand:+ start:316 stop:2196 length:1881 start_codon:yes stop_codon:yes gene_type:complete
LGKFIEKYRGLVSIVVGVVLSVLVLLLWLGNHRNIQETKLNKIEETAQLITLQFERKVQENINSLLNLKKRLEVTEGAYFDYWEYDASNIISQDSSIRFVEWIDSTMVIRKVEPFESNKEAIGLDISKLDYRNTTWIQATRDSVINFTNWLTLVQGPNAFLVDAPVYYDGNLQGTITAGMNFTSDFNSVMKSLNQYHIEIVDGQGTLFYRYDEANNYTSPKNFAISNSLELPGTNSNPWTVTVYPNYIFEEENSFLNSIFNLTIGLLMCLIISILLYFMQTAFVAQKSAYRANQRIRALIESSPMAIYTLDKYGIVSDFWNKAAEEMLGWTQEEALGKFLPHVPDNQKEHFEELMKIGMDEGKIKNKDIVRFKKDGSPIYLRLNVSQIIGDSSENKQMLAIVEDVTKEKEYKEQLENSVHEKEVLLSEVHHRVKNNLAIIVGLIELQKEGLSDEDLKIILNQTQNRIFSISGVHELLYNTDSFTEISFEEYAIKLIDRIRGMFESRGKHISFKHEFNSTNLNINQAIPLGLLLNELITNSFKHAFDKGEGTISISLREDKGEIKVIYKDDGKGFSDDIFESSTTMGVTLIKTLLDQLGADHKLETESGFSLTFTFKVKEKGSHSNI